MHITDVKFYTVPVDFRTWILVKVETSEAGLFGWGEATAEWKARSVSAALEELRELAIGEDPCRIRHLVRKLVKRHYWDAGLVVMSALSGIEVACWDILGKSVGRPVVDLMGGAVRDRVPVYTHLGYGRSDDVYDRSMAKTSLDTLESIIAKGYHAVKVVNVPFHNQIVFAQPRHAFFALMESILDVCVGRIDVALDVHGRCGSVASAESLLGFLESRDLLFVEELLRPSTPAAFAALAAKYRVRLATGERLVDIADFVELARLNAVAIFQPDIAHCGGLLAATQIAAIADGYKLSVAPHNPLGVVASTSGLHYALATPNFLIQEEMSAHFTAAKDFIRHPICFDNGFWTLAPGVVGLGVEVDEPFLKRLAGREEPLLTAAAHDADGSIVDW